ncbi:MAG: glycosyltransferase family 2 protein [Lachnospiraceae bacterium]
MKNVCIVIVNYNGASYQNEAVESLYAMDEQDFDILIVDNYSTDGSADMTQKKWSSVIVLKQGENLGFAGGCNVGIEYSILQGYQYTLLINNDVVVDRWLLSELLKYADDDVITVPKIYFYDKPDTIWYAGGEIRWNRLETHNSGYAETDRGQYECVREIDFLNGCCMLVKNTIFNRIGKFDEKFFLYFEDTDFGLRAQEAGKRILYVPDAKMWHKVSSSAGGEDSKTQVYYMNRNRLYFAKKHTGKFGFRARLYAGLKAFVKWAVSPAYKKNDRYIRKAYMDYRKGKMGKGSL